MQPRNSKFKRIDIQLFPIRQSKIRRPNFPQQIITSYNKNQQDNQIPTQDQSIHSQLRQNLLNSPTQQSDTNYQKYICILIMPVIISSLKVSFWILKQNLVFALLQRQVISFLFTGLIHLENFRQKLIKDFIIKFAYILLLSLSIYGTNLLVVFLFLHLHILSFSKLTTNQIISIGAVIIGLFLVLQQLSYKDFIYCLMAFVAGIIAYFPSHLETTSLNLFLVELAMLVVFLPLIFFINEIPEIVDLIAFSGLSVISSIIPFMLIRHVRERFEICYINSIIMLQYLVGVLQFSSVFWGVSLSMCGLIFFELYRPPRDIKIVK